MANEMPLLKGYDTYRETMVAQEELLYTTLKKDSSHIVEQEVKLINAKKNVVKGMESATAAYMPNGQNLGDAYRKVFEGLEEENKAQDEYVPPRVVWSR